MMIITELTYVEGLCILILAFRAEAYEFICKIYFLLCSSIRVLHRFKFPICLCIFALDFLLTR
jgi:hypothetical protein